MKNIVKQTFRETLSKKDVSWKSINPKNERIFYLENSTEQTVDELIDRFVNGGNPEDMQLCAEKLMAVGDQVKNSAFGLANSNIGGPEYYTGDSLGGPSLYDYGIRVFTSNSAHPFAPNRTFEDMQARLHQLAEENASYRLEVERVNDLLDTLLDEEEMTRTDLFLLQQREKMEEKGWIFAFLSPSVLDLLDECAVEEFLEENIRFIYDVEIPSEEE